MTKEQAIAYITSIMTNYENPLCVDKDNPAYRLCKVWFSENDMIALQMAKEALKQGGESTNEL